ncbi:MAG TPA: hypothetical protein DEG69_00955, partial [Flavobacteriaceae bacterium]|nr:hypothetical protein [Flavobacteriaceae bacterium]
KRKRTTEKLKIKEYKSLIQNRPIPMIITHMMTTMALLSLLGTQIMKTLTMIETQRNKGTLKDIIKQLEEQHVVKNVKMASPRIFMMTIIKKKEDVYTLLFQIVN